MKNKILFIIESLKIGGGAERITSILTKRISGKYELYLLTLKHFSNIYPYSGKYYSLQINLNQKKFYKFLRLHNLVNSIKIYKLITSISPNLIISITDYTNLITILTKTLFKIKIPLITVIHCNPRLVYKKNMPIFNFLLKIFYRLNSVNKIISVSREVENILEKDYNIRRNKLKTIYNCIDLNYINGMMEEEILEFKHIFDDDSIIKFINVGRLDFVKGHKYLIEAFSKVKRQIPYSKLIIIGEGPLRDELEQTIRKKKLENEILFLGFKSNPFKYMAKSDIFVLSSIMEGLPMVLLEALACGLPIISTDCETGPREIINNGQYGFLVNVMDAKDLSEKMILLASDTKLKEKYSKLSLNRANYFEIERIIDQWVNLIDKFTNANNKL